ncbi:response regulator transcription factor [Aquiflexum lacus]|uniref:response regulator transcription factor n=1 Tax=Aquiflexum lacus TaxID=2483805 RepID=UPI001893EEB3|nr:response regulator transcription factor [Aquiflexum lacus]
MSKRILIADDHELFSSGLESLLCRNPDYLVISHFKNGREVQDFFDDAGQADLLVLDLNMPVMDGIQLLTCLQRNYPLVKVLIVSMHQTESSVNLCKKLGAKGFISKDSHLKTLLNGVEEILEGGEYFQDVFQEVSTESGSGFYERLMLEYNLTKREVDIIQLILNQYESNEIAEKLFLSPLTVKTHRKNIFRKLGVRNLTGLVALVNDQPRF